MALTSREILRSQKKRNYTRNYRKKLLDNTEKNYLKIVNISSSNKIPMISVENRICDTEPVMIPNSIDYRLSSDQTI